MKIANTEVLVTGANRGPGRALVEEALRRGAKRAYAGTRKRLAHSDGRVTPLTLDVTNAAARGILDGVEREEEDIFPDPTSASMAESWRSGAAKAHERQRAKLVAENVK